MAWGAPGLSLPFQGPPGRRPHHTLWPQGLLLTCLQGPLSLFPEIFEGARGDEADSPGDSSSLCVGPTGFRRVLRAGAAWRTHKNVRDHAPSLRGSHGLPRPAVRTRPACPDREATPPPSTTDAVSSTRWPGPGGGSEPGARCPRPASWVVAPPGSPRGAAGARLAPGRTSAPASAIP